MGMDGTTREFDRSNLRNTAREVFDAFEEIAASAHAGLTSRGISLDSFAHVNTATSDRLAADLRQRNEDKIGNLQRLCREPAIARLVIEDDEEKVETLYISPAGTVDTRNVRLCSYMAPKGRLTPFAVGEEAEIPLPGGARSFLIREKMTFSAVEFGDGSRSPLFSFGRRLRR